MNVILKAALWMTGAIASFSFMAVAGRDLSTNYDTFEIMLYRSLVGVVIVIAITSYTNRWHQLRFDQFGQHFIRNVFHFYRPKPVVLRRCLCAAFAQVFALEFTSPLWVAILAPVILGEKMTPHPRAVLPCMGFVGILIVARPTCGDPQYRASLPRQSAAIFFAMTIYADQTAHSRTIRSHRSCSSSPPSSSCLA